MQTFMLENYEGYTIWFPLRRDYEPISIYMYHRLHMYLYLYICTSIHCDKKFKITRDSSLELYKVLGPVIIQGTLLSYFEVA